MKEILISIGTTIVILRIFKIIPIEIATYCLIVSFFGAWVQNQ